MHIHHHGRIVVAKFEHNMRMSPPARDAYRGLQEAHMMQAVEAMAKAPQTNEVGPEAAWAGRTGA